MIELYTWTTPNGRKASVMLEECGLLYEVRPINIGADEQFAPSFIQISPNSRIPAIVDREAEGGPLSIFESGAILQYLAEKTGKYLSNSYPARAKTLEWLNWQMGNVGPMIGQAGHFALQAPEQIPYAIDRYTSESARLLKVLDEQLGRTEYMAGEYSIADIATYPWVVLAFPMLQQMKPDIVGEGANATAWLEKIGARPAVKKGMAVPVVEDTTA